MHTPAASLLAHQRSATRRPSLSLSASPRRFGPDILAWTRIYRGPEPDVPHAAVLTADGYLIVARNSAGAIQASNRYTTSGTLTPSGSWVSRDTSAVTTATPALINRANGETFLFYAKNNDLRYVTSSDNGQTWGSPVTLVTEASALTHVAAAFRSGSDDIAVFYGLSGAATNLRRLRRTGGAWEGSSSNWTNGASVTAVYELAAAHDGSDFLLTLSGLDTASGSTHWACLCGDLGFPGIWGGLTVIDRSDAASTVTHRGAAVAFLPSLRPIAAWAVRETTAVASVSAREASAATALSSWTEPTPFEPASLTGPAYAVSPSVPGTIYAATANGVWIATLPSSLTLGSRLVAARVKQNADGIVATLELDDSDGGFAALGLAPGWTLTLTPGYASGTAGAQEAGLTFTLAIDAIRHTLRDGRRTVALDCSGALDQLARWRPAAAWQSACGALTREQLLIRIAARAGVAAAAGTNPDDPSSDFAAYSPSFAWAPGEDGRTILPRLLGPLNDGIRAETGTLTVVNRTSRLFEDVVRRLAPTAWWRFTRYDRTILQDHASAGTYAAALFNTYTTGNTSGAPLQGGQPSTYLNQPTSSASYGSTSPTTAPSLTNFSIVALIRNPASGTRSILASDNGGGAYWHMGMTGYTLAFGDSADAWTDTRGSALNDGAWHLVAVTRQAGTVVTFYVDGVAVGTRASGSGAAVNTGAVIGVGIRAGTANSWYQGDVAETQLYNKLLSARDIADLWRAVSPAVYAFGGTGGHPITSFTALDQPPPGNWLRLQGSARQAESFNGDSVSRHGPRLAAYRTLDASTDGRATAYAANRLRQDLADDTAAEILAPWATGPQLFDHISVTHPALSQTARVYRITALSLDFAPGRYGVRYELAAP